MIFLFPKQKNQIEFLHSTISMLMHRHSIYKFTLDSTFLDEYQNIDIQDLDSLSPSFWCDNHCLHFKIVLTYNSVVAIPCLQPAALLIYNFIALENMCKKLDKFIKFPLERRAYQKKILCQTLSSISHHIFSTQKEKIWSSESKSNFVCRL